MNGQSMIPISALQRTAFELVAHAVGIRDGTAVLGDDQPRRDNGSSLLVHVDLGDQGHISVIAFVKHTADASATGDAA